MLYCSLDDLQEFLYSYRYYDDVQEYRHVYLPCWVKKKVTKLLCEKEWRSLGVSLTSGWVHYTIYEPETRILLFKRPRRFRSLPKEERDAFIAKTDELTNQLEKQRAILRNEKEKHRDRSRLAPNEKLRRCYRYEEAKKKRALKASSSRN